MDEVFEEVRLVADVVGAGTALLVRTTVVGLATFAELSALVIGLAAGAVIGVIWRRRRS